MKKELTKEDIESMLREYIDNQIEPASLEEVEAIEADYQKSLKDRPEHLKPPDEMMQSLKKHRDRIFSEYQKHK